MTLISVSKHTQNINFSIERCEDVSVSLAIQCQSFRVGIQQCPCLHLLRLECCQTNPNHELTVKPLYNPTVVLFQCILGLTCANVIRESQVYHHSKRYEAYPKPLALVRLQAIRELCQTYISIAFKAVIRLAFRSEMSTNDMKNNYYFALQIILAL